MTALQPVRGTRDLIGEEFLRHRHVIETARRVADLYGLSQWETPVFEDTRVFSRTLGETSDVVTKEMYTFEDRGGDSITLRPEMTAGVCRALVSNGLTQDLPQKVFYAGPMFRYERPQKGRYRQFHQIGAEFLGTAEPIADAEMIALGAHILEALGIAASCTLEVNTLGDSESRNAWRAALVDYFSAHADKLSADSKLRLEKNPLRILDSKDEGDRALLADAPTIEKFLTDGARAHWDGVRENLVRFGVAFVESPRIVRGLDYYGHTAFEFVTSELGAQGTVMAGGRYDGLVEAMGGPPTPCIGWAAGVERLAMLAAFRTKGAGSIVLIPIGTAAEEKAPAMLQALRRGNIRAEMDWRGNLKRRMERANKRGARTAVIFGEAELAAGQAQVKDLATGEQRAVALDRLNEALAG
jgi:histidyl-tRNA synthetase